jgi:PAS domain S-box-containing protein
MSNVKPLLLACDEEGAASAPECRVLLVEDDEVDRRQVKLLLAKLTRGVRFHVDTAGTLREVALCLSDNRYDVMLLDLGLPDSSGLDTIQEAHEMSQTVPIIVLTGLDDEDVGVQAIRRGAEDYLIKGPSLEHALVRTIRHAIERKVAKDKMRQAAEEWQHTFDAIADFIFIVDEESRIVKANKAFAQVIGPKVPNFLGRKCREVMHRLGSQRPDCTSFQRIEGQTSAVSEVDDPVIGVPLLVTTSPILDDKGKVTGIVHVAKDISQMKKAHREMKEAIEMKSQFIAVASHELRTPLTALKESIEIVNEAAVDKLDAEMRRFLDLAKRNIDRLSRLINDILDLQKLEAGKVELHMQEFDINEVVKEVWASMLPLAEHKGLHLSLSLIDRSPRLRFDKDKITQVLVNLVSNAIKFAEVGDIRITTGWEEDAAVVTVADTGPGIQKEDLTRLFQKFQQLGPPGQRKTGGTGLGLAICKQIVERHSGKIWVESEVGVGTRFAFLLPVKQGKTSHDQKDADY